MMNPHLPKPTANGQRQTADPHRRGLSLVEMLVSLAITAMLLTATMVAIDASFHAYAVAAETASTQTSTRMVTNRMLALIRNSYAHEPIYPDAAAGVTLSGSTLTSPYITVVDLDGNIITLTHDATNQRLMYTIEPAGGGTITTQPILGGVTDAVFTLTRQRDNDDLWVISRGNVDFTVQPDDDASLDLESGDIPAVRVIASTKPRKLE